MAKTKAARDSGRHEKAPTPFAPPPALLAQDLAALCRERMLSSPNFVALVGTTLPAAAASAPSADDGTNDLLLDLSEENLPMCAFFALVFFLVFLFFSNFDDKVSCSLMSFKVYFLFIFI